MSARKRMISSPKQPACFLASFRLLLSPAVPAKDWRGIRWIDSLGMFSAFSSFTGHATQPPLVRFACDIRDALYLHEEKTHTTKDAFEIRDRSAPLPSRQTWPEYNACGHFVKLIA